MLLLRALLLWSLVSLHVLGGAVLFRRFFEAESAWLGFLVPSLAFCLGLNFLEHFIPLPSLLGLLPLTTIGAIVLLVRPTITWPEIRHRFVPRERAVALGKPAAFDWSGFWLPGGVFLGSFAYTFLIRCAEPNVLASSDGLADLNLIANFLKGDTLPPTDGWLPPFKLQYYYTFQHYAASVVARLLGVEVGTAYNLAHALVSAFTCFAAAAIAWQITSRLWIAVAMPFLIESAATGSSAYLRLTDPSVPPWTMSNLSGGLENADGNPIWKLLATAPYRERLELQPPGYWTYRDEYHPNAGGHLLTLFALWVLMELFRHEKTDWPWIAALLIPLLAIATSTWALPITALIGGGGLLLAYTRGRRARNPTAVFIVVALGVVMLWPSLSSLFGSPLPTPIMGTHREWRTPLYEFLIQWWPVYLPWLSLLFVWPRLPTPVKWAMAVVPLMLLGIENITIEDGRYNTIEKMWGYTYGAGLVVFFATVAMQRGAGYRLLTVLLFASAAVSLYGWWGDTAKWLDSSNFFHLEGNGIVRQDPQRGRLLQVLSQFQRKTVLTGKVDWDYYESPALAVFTNNRSYIAWTFAEEHYGHEGENVFREKQVNDFYAGQTPDPLGFLTGNSIRAVVIWPGDRIPDALIASLKNRLAPAYAYVDCKGDGPNNAGVFLYQPSIAEKPASTQP